jgi:hypothetical protein
MQNFSGIGVLVALCVCRLSAAARHLLGAKISCLAQKFPLILAPAKNK